jgi:hypothetical protein
VSRVEVGAGTLANIAARVQTVRDDLESLATSVPAAPDAGDMSGVIASLLSDLLAVSGEVSQGSADAADAVRRAGVAYQETDAASAQAFARLYRPGTQP